MAHHLKDWAGEDGIALLLVLWVLTILMTVALSFSYMAHTETYATLSFKEGAENKFLAEAGIERGIAEILYRRKNRTIEGSDVWKVDGTAYSGTLGSGTYRVRIVDESGKVDINTVSDVVLKNLLITLGVKEDIIDTIVDSIKDWIDPDDLHRLNGAESDYYMSLPAPYKAKNAPIDTIEELMLVKGVTPDVLYGSESTRGLKDFITVNTKSGQINVNSAPREVLLSIPGMTPEVADAIISIREAKPLTDLRELGISAQSAPYISLAESSTFTIESTGFRETEKEGYAIKATVILEGNNKYRYAYYKSPAGVKE